MRMDTQAILGWNGNYKFSMSDPQSPLSRVTQVIKMPLQECGLTYAFSVLTIPEDNEKNR